MKKSYLTYSTMEIPENPIISFPQNSNILHLYKNMIFDVLGTLLVLIIIEVRRRHDHCMYCFLGIFYENVLLQLHNNVHE